MPDYRIKPSIREMLIAGLALAAVMAAQISVVGGWTLIPRSLWLDEIFTYQIASDPKPSHAMIALATGGDTNPPTLFFFQRVFGELFGGVTDSTLHLFSLLSIWLALLGMYAALRLAVNEWAAAVGTLMVWASPLIIVHAFEARFYGPLLAATVWTFFLIHLRRSTLRDRSVTRFLLAVASIILCTLHYFGVLALGTIVAFYLALDPEPMRKRLRNAWPTIFGPIALACCAPLLMSQRRSQTVDTWIDAPNWPQFQKFIVDLFPVRPMSIILYAVAATIAWKFYAPDPPDIRPRRARAWRVLSGLIGLGAFPFVIIAFSYLMQPAMVARYAIQGIAALGAVAALLLMRSPRVILAATCAALIVSGTIDLDAHRARWAGEQGFDANLDRLVADIVETTDHRPVVFELRQNLYPVWHAEPTLVGRLAYWDFDVKPGRRDQTAFRIYERDQARRVRILYGGPTLIREDNFPTLGTFYIVTGTVKDEARLRQILPTYNVRHIKNTIYEVKPKNP